MKMINNDLDNGDGGNDDDDDQGPSQLGRCKRNFNISFLEENNTSNQRELESDQQGFDLYSKSANFLLTPDTILAFRLKS